MMNKTPLELYIHIPFCVRKCDYCDFLSGPADEQVREAYMSQLITEIRMQGANCREDYYVSSVFIGGGTPSVLKGSQIANIMSAIFESWTVEASAEITIECNPGTVDDEKLSDYVTSGINRLSIGLQSAHNEELKILGRIHTYEDFLRTYQSARNAGFGNISVDLMSGIPGQTAEIFRDTLRKVTMLKPEHISAYSLILEEGTPFHTRYSSPEGLRLLPSEEEERAIYHMTEEVLLRNDYHRYEISNYARTGFESRHNIGYWTGAEYLGLGLGSSSYIRSQRFHNETDLRVYLSLNLQSNLAALYQDIQNVGLVEAMEEYMIFGLRMTKGVSSVGFYERFGVNMFTEFDAAIRKNVRNGLLILEGQTIRYSELGLDLANQVELDFFRH